MVAAADHARIDSLERSLLAQDSDPSSPVVLVDMPLRHLFTPNIYTRQIFMPAGTVVTSKIHKLRHPFAILRGRVSVFIPGGPVEVLEAPFLGVTEPGTRRVLYVHEDCVWVTFHPNPTDTADLDELEQYLIEPHPDEGSIYQEYIRRLDERTERVNARIDVREQIHNEYVNSYLSDQYEYGGAP